MRPVLSGQRQGRCGHEKKRGHNTHSACSVAHAVARLRRLVRIQRAGYGEDNRWYLFKLGYGGGPYDLDDFEIGDELYIEYYMEENDGIPWSGCVKIMPLEEYEANRERVDAKRAETYARQRGDREEGRP